MKIKFMLQLTGLVAVVLLVAGTANFYLTHPDKRGVDERGFQPHHRQFPNERNQ